MKIRKNDYISNTNVIEAAKRERYTFSQIQSSVLSLLQEPNSTFEVIVTSIYSNSPYDVLIEQYTNSKLTKRYFIEIKNRYQDYSDFVFEDYKYNQLKKFIVNEFDEILYINSSNKRTYVWNITELNKAKKLPKGKKDMNSCTAKSRTIKRTKNVRYLDYLDAKEISFSFTEDKYQSHLNPKPVILTKESKLKSIF